MNNMQIKQFSVIGSLTAKADKLDTVIIKLKNQLVFFLFFFFFYKSNIL